MRPLDRGPRDDRVVEHERACACTRDHPRNPVGERAAKRRGAGPDHRAEHAAAGDAVAILRIGTSDRDQRVAPRHLAEARNVRRADDGALREPTSHERFDELVEAAPELEVDVERDVRGREEVESLVERRQLRCQLAQRL